MECLSNVFMWFIFVLFVMHGGNAALLETCADDAACKATGGDPNAICSMDTTAGVGGDADGNCICTGSFKATDDKCVTKGNGDSCKVDSDCAAVTNSACESDNTCGCADGYKQTLTTCSAVLGTICTGATDCTDHVQNSECPDSKKCSCVTNYIQDGNVCAKELGQECSTGQCVTNAECDTKCKCSDGYVDTNGLCAAKSSAVTTRLAISVAVMSILCIVQNIF